MTELHALTATELLEGYRKHTLSPVEVAQAVMRRIEAFNPRFNAFNLVSDRLLEEAKASEARWAAGQPRGLLDGVPVSIKDLILTRGWPTLRGSKTIDPGGPWNDDAPATARLREHGALLIGIARGLDGPGALGVVSEGAPVMALSVAAGHPVECGPPATFADGMAVRGSMTPGLTSAAAGPCAAATARKRIPMARLIRRPRAAQPRRRSRRRPASRARRRRRTPRTRRPAR